jgi:GNAT superfamily N-acetyltransferase
MIIRALTDSDRAAWEPLWRGYQEFYESVIPAEVTDLTWRRFHDPGEPMHALGAFEENRLAGILHYLFHRSCWTAGPYCYLQDLFTVKEFRGRGVGRALIEATYRAAREAGASQVYWLTHETNTHAMLLYDKVAERSGFVKYRNIFTTAPE